MLTLYDSAFSPFARKVRLALETKSLEHTTIDGLALANREALAKVNPRVEVPTLVHDGLLVVGSSDIVAYLEKAFPSTPRLYPEDNAAWIHARAWERCADAVIDAILINVSYWAWAERDDEMPDGLLDAARRDMEQIYAALERDLSDRDFVSHETLSIADIALFPHIAATKGLGVGYDKSRHPRIDAWLKRLRALPPFTQDLARARRFVVSLAGAGYERKRIFWRGDRVEWMLARGQHRWFMRELEEDRVLWPGLGVPGTR